MQDHVLRTSPVCRQQWTLKSGRRPLLGQLRPRAPQQRCTVSPRRARWQLQRASLVGYRQIQVKAARAAMARARAPDSANDESACKQAIADAEGVLGQ